MSVLWFTATDYPLISSGHCIVCPSIYGYWLPFGIFWPLYCLSFDLRLLITFDIFWPLYCLSSIYGYWLPFVFATVLWYLRFTATDYPLVSSGHCIVCPLIYGLITLWYLLAIVLSVLRFPATDPFILDLRYWLPFGIFWPLYCLSFDLRLLITLWYLRFTATDYPLVSSSHCIVCPSIYGYWLPFGILDLQLLITLWYLLAIALYVLRFTATDYPLISFGHCIVCPSIYGYWSPFGILDLQLLITLWYHLAIVLSVLRFTATDYPLVSSGHCIVCPSIYGYWLPFGILDLQLLITLWYLLAIVLSVLRFTATDYPLVSSHFWPLYYLSFDLRLLITPLVSSGHCIVCPSISGYCLPFGILDLRLLITLWYLLAIVLSVLWFTATDYPLVS